MIRGTSNIRLRVLCLQRLPNIADEFRCNAGSRSASRIPKVGNGVRELGIGCQKRE